MTPDDLKLETRVWHKLKRKPGTVKAQPRARSPVVRLLLDGNISPQYYAIDDLVLGDQAATPAETPASPPPPEGALPTSAFPPQPSPTAPIEVKLYAPSDDYKGEITLDRLLSLRGQLRAALDSVDGAVVRIQVQQGLKEAAASIRYEGDAQGRCVAAADAVKAIRAAREGLKS